MKKDYKLLEFDKILNMIEKNLKLEKSIEIITNQEIYNNKSELENELNILKDGIDMYKYDNEFELENIFSMDDIINNLNILGSYLSVDDLNILHKNLISYRITKTRIKNLKDKYKNLYNHFSSDLGLNDIEKLLDDILDNNYIKDTASIGLRDIRYQKNMISQNIKDKIQDIFSNKEYQKAVSEHITTTRNDRIVIAVKTDFKYLIKGIEHDKSSSGTTTYIEPLNIVSLNNKFREYEAREREEIRKILIRISEILRSKKDEISVLYDKLIYLDILNSKIIYALNNSANVIKIANKPYINIFEAKHPLLNKDIAIPLSISLGMDEKNVLLITGPNTGGKTISLKTVGLLTLMTLLAYPIPANEKSEIGMFSNILVDIGDEQSIEQNLSSFSAHVSNVARIIDNAKDTSLIILDELGSGTDPIEGSSFAMAVIDYLKEKRAKILVSTHYSELKHHSINDFNIISASMEFDINTLKPTYRLIVGIPGESNALIIASKYGIKNEIIEKAKSYVGDENKKIDSIIIDLKKQTQELADTRDEILKIKEENVKLKKEYEEKIREIELEKNEIIRSSRKEADDYMRNMQNKIKNLMTKLNNEEKNKNELKNIQKSINMIRESINEDKNSKINKDIVENTTIDLKIGDDVLVKNLNQNGKVLKILDKNKIQIQTGILKIVVNYNDIVKLNIKKEKPKFISSKKEFSNVKSEIDVRGKFAEEAIEEIDKYLDTAILNGFNQVYIVHGKGTMVLRKKIWEYLKQSKYVNSFENAPQNEGGLGCTIVHLK